VRQLNAYKSELIIARLITLIIETGSEEPCMLGLPIMRN